MVMTNLTRSRWYGVLDQTKLFTCNIVYPHNLKIVLANGFLYIQMYVKIPTFLYLVTRSPFDVFVHIISNWIISSCYLVPIRCNIQWGINVDNTINIDTIYIVNKVKSCKLYKTVSQSNIQILIVPLLRQSYSVWQVRYVWSLQYVIISLLVKTMWT
jgi:hypothetical protein